MTGDAKSDHSYWDALWRENDAQLPLPIDPNAPGLNNYVPRALHEAFFPLLKRLPKNSLLLEIGCARSQWLPYFAQQYGFQVTGIDYSDTGCAQAKKILEKSSINSEIYCEDIFNPTENLKNCADIIFSLGVFEHFSPTSRALSAGAEYLKAGGLMLTVIPNMVGIIGLLQKSLHREVYDIHVPLSREALLKAHEEAGLTVLTAEYLLPISLCAFAPNPRRPAWFNSLLMRTLSATSKIVWLAGNKGLRLPPNRVTSPYVMCLARKQEEQG